MTDTSSSILDPVTGLPLDQFSGIIQQIPLGQQVFPFADLDADGRMTRQPIYGDDVLPTTSLITGQDTTGAARAGTMDTARRLYTREAVFQNMGQKIPDGTTAPIDVNVRNGGGGGGGLTPVAYNTSVLMEVSRVHVFNGSEEELLNTTADHKYFYGYTIDVLANYNEIFAYPVNIAYDLRLGAQGSVSGGLSLGSGQLAYLTAAPAANFQARSSRTVMFPVPLDIALTFGSLGLYGFYLTLTGSDGYVAACAYVG